MTFIMSHIRTSSKGIRTVFLLWALGFDIYCVYALLLFFMNYALLYNCTDITDITDYKCTVIIIKCTVLYSVLLTVVFHYISILELPISEENISLKE